MPVFRSAVIAFSVALLILSMTVAASAQSIAEAKEKVDKEDASVQHAIQQLRAIAELIKKCPGWRTPDADYGSFFGSAPLNVIWDVEQRQSTRSDKLGYIEFVQHAGYDSALPLTCRKKDVDCQTHNKVLAKLLPTWRDFHPFDQFRYEFDLAPDGLEFARAQMRHENADEHWAATELKHGCLEDAILSILNHPSEPLVDSSSVAAAPAQLQVTSTPNGADIEIDGSFVGNTPSTVGVTAGQHDISVKRTGFKPWGRRIAVSTGQVNVNAVLEPEPK